jgi:hypothetical protein
MRPFQVSPGSGPCPRLILRQRPHRTDIHALAAENAVALVVGIVAGGANLGLSPPVAIADGQVDLTFQPCAQRSHRMQRLKSRTTTLVFRIGRVLLSRSAKRISVMP